MLLRALALLLLLSVSLVAVPLPPVGPVPAWVDPVGIPEVPADADGASLLLLHDRQVYAGATLEVFDRRVWKVRTLSGVQALAQHQLEWEPGTERLTLHGAWIWRDGARHPAWHPDDARVLQRETGLDEGVYDGRLTLGIELRDLRPGDVLELASTVTGENPVFRGHVSLSRSQAAFEPVTLTSFRLVWQRGRELAWKTHGGAVPPSVESHGSGRVFRWAVHDVKALKLERNVPADIEQVPSVEFSDWASWAEVRAWAEDLFSNLKPDVRFEAALARFKAMERADRVRSIVRFVQDDIRYVGVELGPHTHQPHSPAWVLERGFGDCKDKTLLLVALLRAIGQEAWPTLVHSTNGARLAGSLPSPLHFDHAIARVDFPTGPRYLDPTQTHRRGDPANWDDPGSHFALLIRPGTTALETLPTTAPGSPTWELHQRWTVPSFTEPAVLEVETVASRNNAAWLRRRVNTVGRDELAELRRVERQRALKVTLASRGLDWTDDEAADRVTVTEKYEVTGFFDERQRHVFEVLALDGSLDDTPPEEPRSLPLATSHPVAVKETITYQAPELLSVARFDLENRTITNPAFSLALKGDVTGSSLLLEWTLVSRSDRVAVADLDRYRIDLKDARGSLGYRVSQGAGEGPGNKPQKEPVWLIVLLVGVIFVGLFLIVLMNRPEPTVERPSLRARLKRWRFRAKQRARPGELASVPLALESLADAVKHFKGRACPAGHAWPAVSVLDAVRLGDERISVIGRRCAACGASEHRYAKLRSVSE